MKRFALLLLLVAACGGKSAPAAEPSSSSESAETAAPAGDCCCDYIKEEGDPAGDDWSENQTYELMSPESCSDLSGTCGDASNCDAPAAED